MSQWHKPVIFIVGSTGTGKSKLALHIAKKFKGEIISADSMQVYRGLDIITNKVTDEEQNVAPHHMFNVVSPLQRFTVVDFRNKALPIVDDLLKRNALPIIVGGTYYYVESLLWQVLLSPHMKPDDSLLFDAHDPIDDAINLNDETRSNEPQFHSVLQNDLKLISNETLYKHLRDKDPKAADLVHPNSRRRVIRYLQVIEQTGRLYSELLKEQQSRDGGNYLGGPLRFSNSCILWLTCDQEELDKRLDARVDTMISRGLIKELSDFHKIYNEERVNASKEPDYTHGIFQSIGFKEFHNFLVMDENSRNSDSGKRLFDEGVSALKLVTRRYARKQIKWINRRFLKSADRQVPLVYSLDCTDLKSWESEVQNKADIIIDAIIEGKNCSVNPLVMEPAPIYKKKLYTCSDCNRVFAGEEQWNLHLNSKRHKKMVDGKRKQMKVTKLIVPVSWWGRIIQWIKSLFYIS